MKNGFKTYDDVKSLLENNKKCRVDDMFLYRNYVASKLWEFDKYSQDIIFAEMFSDIEIRKAYDIRTFETISRARRKIQETCPDLVDQECKKNRLEKTMDYKNLAIGINSNLS